jgi:hypothetical protein
MFETGRAPAERVEITLLMMSHNDDMGEQELSALCLMRHAWAMCAKAHSSMDIDPHVFGRGSSSCREPRGANVAYCALLIFCVDKRHQFHGYAIVSRP